MLEHRRRGHEVVMIHFCYFHLEISQFIEGCIETWQNRIMFVNPLLRFFIHPKVGLAIYLYKLLALAAIISTNGFSSSCLYTSFSGDVAKKRVESSIFMIWKMRICGRLPSLVAKAIST